MEPQWIAQRAIEPGYKFTNLAHHMTPEMLSRSYSQLRKDAAGGIDGKTVEEYGEELEENIGKLHTRLKERRYRAPAVKRVWIPKDGGKHRPLGLPTVEDKIVQHAAKSLLEPIYEEIFTDNSFGYRPGRGAHDALETVWQECMSLKGGYIIDADIRDYFGSIDHGHLREFIKRKVVDGSIIRLIGKWLNAGVLEEGKYTKSEQGTPQGGVISPLLANIYLHYVLDEWFETTVKSHLRGRAFLVRYADDFVIGVEQESDARRIMEVLPKRMQKYGLEIHAEKTRLLDFRRPKLGDKKGNSHFDFLGFRHFWKKSQKGNWVVQRKTRPERQARTLKRLNQWCRDHRHWDLETQWKVLSRKLRGHYQYFGIMFNITAVGTVKHETERLWLKWLNRRGGRKFTWDEYRRKILDSYPLPQPRTIPVTTPKVRLLKPSCECFA